MAIRAVGATKKHILSFLSLDRAHVLNCGQKEIPKVCSVYTGITRCKAR